MIRDSENQNVSRRDAIIALLACTLTGGGCSLLNKGLSSVGLDSRPTNDSTSGIPKIPRAADTVQLEMLFVERPVDDPLLGEQLWEGMDVVGDDPVVRKRLLANGIRVGHSSATPNRTIETLLGLTTDGGAAAPVDEKKLTGRRVVRPSGGDTVAQTSPFRSQSTVKIVGDDGVLMKDFQTARCVMRIKAKSLQKGWATLEFLPEIHHGQRRYRPMSSEAGWSGGTSQKIHRLYSQRFSVTLNVGDMAVISADNLMPGSLGGHFFMAGDQGDQVQRVLIVRLTDINPATVTREQ